MHSHAFATRLGIELPVMSCSGRGAVVYPASIARVPSPYVNPKTWVPPARLVQGMKIVITGPTVRPRLELAKDLAGRGLDVMNNVSNQTRLVVCNEPAHVSVKHEKVRTTGIPVLTETALVALLDDIEPGIPRGTEAKTPTSRPPRHTTRTTPAAPTVPWGGRNVLVLGGTAAQAATVREQVGALGARVLVNLGARTTHALCLNGAETDRRYEKILERNIPILTLSDLDLVTVQPAASEVSGLTEAPAAAVLGRGHVIDLPAGVLRFSLSASWRAQPVDQQTDQTFEVDVVAFALSADGHVDADDDFVFYNQPSTPDGGVRPTVDGSCEQGVDVDLEALDEDTVRVRVAAAIDGDATFGVVGAIHLSVTDTETGGEVASATLDAATEERTLVLAELYRRADMWRLRAVGQGYEYGLDRLAADLGVEIG